VSRQVVTEEYNLNDEDDGALLDVTTVYSGSEADGMRYRLASSSLAEISTDYLNYYAQTDSGIEVAAPLDVRDDRLSNEISVREHYRLPTFWKDGERALDGDAIDWVIDEPQTRLRTTPLELEYPVVVQHTILVKLPRVPDFELGRKTIETDAFLFTSTRQRKHNTITILFSYSSRAGFVAADEVEAHLRSLDKVQRSLRVWISKPRVLDGVSIPDLSWLLWVGGILFGATILVTAWNKGVIKWKRAAFQRKERGRLGETPRFAANLPTEAALESHLQKLRCVCGGVASDAFERREVLNYSGRPLSLITRRCSRCDQEIAFYYKLNG